MRHQYIVLFLTVFTSSAAIGQQVFIFGGNANGFTGSSEATLASGDMQLSIRPAVVGSLLVETHENGLGVDSRAAVDPVYEPSGEVNKFDLDIELPALDSFTANTTYFGEAIEFSFSRPGVLTGLLFDGVKDESFEFFRLEVPGGEVYSLFDSEIGLRILDVATITEPGRTLLDVGNDDIVGLSIPFAANQSFLLTYGEFIVLDDQLRRTHPITGAALNNQLTLGNGARFQGIVVHAVPEAASFELLLLAMAVAVPTLWHGRKQLASRGLRTTGANPAYAKV